MRFGASSTKGRNGTSSEGPEAGVQAAHGAKLRLIADKAWSLDGNGRTETQLSGRCQMKKIIALLLAPMLASAEPGPTTQYLFNEPATLLDIAMVRLDDLTDEFENRVGLYWTEGDETKFFKAEINSYYEPDDDKIYVSLLAMNSEARERQMEEGCRNAMSQMNIWLLKSLHRMFSHVGYEDPSRPADFYSGLKELFEIRCHFSSGRDTSEGRFWAYRKLGSLGDDEMTIGKWRMRN